MPKTTDVLTPEEQQALDYIRFRERRMLREDVWVNPFQAPGAHACAIAMNLKWWLPREPGEMAEPDLEKVQPVLDSLVEKGKLVVVGHYERLISRNVEPHYGTATTKPGTTGSGRAACRRRGCRDRAAQTGVRVAVWSAKPTHLGGA